MDIEQRDGSDPIPVDSNELTFTAVTIRGLVADILVARRLRME